MNTQAFRVTSNIATHGHRFAVDSEVKRFRRMGCSPDRAFGLAAQLVFGRYVPAR